MKASTNIIRFPEKPVVDKRGHLVLSLCEVDSRDCLLGRNGLVRFKLFLISEEQDKKDLDFIRTY